jgi:hypothetical protein
LRVALDRIVRQLGEDMDKKLNEKTTKAVKKWCRKKKLKVTGEPRHIHPRAYVIGHAAPRCLVVAVPWPDSEPQCRESDKANPLTTLHTFDDTLKAGDWCATAYVCHGDVQETVAIHVVA